MLEFNSEAYSMDDTDLCISDPVGMPGTDYHYPGEIHIGAYFTDMTVEHGSPREVIYR